MSNQVSPRERQILEQAAEGLTDKEIANNLKMSVASVRTYWERVRAKTQTKNRAEAVVHVLVQELRTTTDAAVQARMDRDILVEEAEGLAVFSIDTCGKILDWNPGVLRVLGFKEDEFVGEPFDIVFTPDDVKAGEVQREMQEAMDRGRCLERRYHVKKNGTQIWVDGTLVALRNEAGQVRRFAKIMRDDTERKSMEEEIQRLRARTSQGGVQPNNGRMGS